MHVVDSRLAAPDNFRHMGQWAVDQVGENGFDDRVLAMSDVRLSRGQVSVGEERVVAPHREERVAVTGVFNPPYNQASGAAVLGGSERGVADFGDFGIRDPVSGVGITHRARVFHWGPGGLVDRVDGPLDSAIAGHHHRELGAASATRLDHRAVTVESPRTRICPLAPQARAVAMAWATIRPAPLPEPVLPARSRIPAITGAAPGVLIVVANGDRPLRRTCFPATFVCP